MEIFIIASVAFGASILTFFSGFGLGTMLAPVFAIFFPVDLAIALTGIVHFSNNLFKITLVGKNADKDVLIRFGIPAILASFAGAWLLLKLSGLEPLFIYQVGSRLHIITPVKLVIAILLVIFAIIEILPSNREMKFDRKNLPIGGLLSGFFGGLSGLQGAIRSAFLVKSGLNKEAYIGTAVVIACLVDITRLSVYVTRYIKVGISNNLSLVIISIIAAITGAVIGKKLLKKVTIEFIQKLVALMLLIISLALGTGLI